MTNAAGMPGRAFGVMTAVNVAQPLNGCLCMGKVEVALARVRQHAARARPALPCQKSDKCDKGASEHVAA